MQFLAGNAVALLENGEQYFPALEAEIDRAEREIFLQSYIFEDDGTGARIAAALARAAGRGVAVRVMVDGFGGRSFVSRLMPRLREAGVQV
ncbi:MAG: cardiolipin synthase ClsB, partial [Burkholderiales bacterium]|nr:cardiolipin synthase ClsB [Burkholderiales bacterium]